VRQEYIQQSLLKLRDYFKSHATKLFFFLLLKTLRGIYRDLILGGWWLILLLFAIFYIFKFQPQSLLFASIYLCCFAARSSTDQKDFYYFLKMSPFFCYAFMLIPFTILPYKFITSTIVFPVLNHAIIIPFVVTALLFLLDNRTISYNPLSSLHRAFLMMTYNYPLYLFPSLFSFIMYNLLGYGILYSVFIVPIVLSTLSTIYIKRVHEQFQLYYITIS
jgi:hypothetical protein